MNGQLARPAPADRPTLLLRGIWFALVIEVTLVALAASAVAVLVFGGAL